METKIEIKQEIKEEPFDPDLDFNPEALIPKVEVSEAAPLIIPKVEINEDVAEPRDNKSLSCPKCDITYYSAMVQFIHSPKGQWK